MSQLFRSDKAETLEKNNGHYEFRAVGGTVASLQASATFHARSTEWSIEDNSLS